MEAFQLRVVCYSSQDENQSGRWRYANGHTYLETVPVTATYAEFIFRLSEKTSSGVGVKYLLCVPP